MSLEGSTPAGQTTAAAATATGPGAVAAAVNLAASDSAGAPLFAPLSFRLAAGHALCLRGASGAGKSSLLGYLGLLAPPPHGSLHVLGHDVTALGAEATARLRRTQVGLAGQSCHLVPQLDVAANVTLMARINGQGVDGGRLARALAAVDLTDLAARPAHKLSGGEAVRAALARLLYLAPALALVDEPTAGQDPARAAAVTAALVALQKGGSAVVVATHDAALAAALGPVLWLQPLELS